VVGDVLLTFEDRAAFLASEFIGRHSTCLQADVCARTVHVARHALQVGLSVPPANLRRGRVSQTYPIRLRFSRPPSSSSAFGVRRKQMPPTRRVALPYVRRRTEA
jgi:hypothetical protein